MDQYLLQNMDIFWFKEKYITFQIRLSFVLLALHTADNNWIIQFALKIPIGTAMKYMHFINTERPVVQ